MARRCTSPRPCRGDDVADLAGSTSGRIIPAPLLAIGVITAVVLGLDVDVPRVGDLASLAGGLPAFSLPAVPLNLETLSIIFPYAFILAAIGLIEAC